MQRSNRSRSLLLAVTVALVACGAWGQPLPTEWAPRDVARLYGDLVDRWIERGELGEAIVRAAREGAGLEGQDGRYVVCASLPGTGGNPRVDGGGNPRMDGGHGTHPGDWGGTLLAPFPPVNATLWPYAAPDGHQVAFPPAGTVGPPRSRMAVIDAFDVDVLAAIGSGAQLDATDLWAVLIASLLGGRSDTSPVPHGNLVLYHLLAPWAHPDGLHVSFREAGNPRVLHLRGDTWADAIELHLLEITYGDVTTIADAMQSAEALGDAVVVASWGLVDCTLAAGYHAQAEETRASGSAPASFFAYLAAALERSGEAAELLGALCDAFEEQITEAVGSIDCRAPSNHDLLAVAALAQMDARARQAVVWQELGETVVFASAGNQGLPFPMPPAAWPGVVAVEACMAGEPDRRAAFSNGGAVGFASEFSAQALGAWFATPASGSTFETLGYWGTSFAAPAAAAAYAADPWSGTGLHHVEPCVMPPAAPAQ